MVELAASDLSLVAAVPARANHWALAWAPDGTTLYATHLLGPGVSAFATTPLALTTTFPLADGPASNDPTEPHGPVAASTTPPSVPGHPSSGSRTSCWESTRRNRRSTSSARSSRRCRSSGQPATSSRGCRCGPTRATVRRSATSSRDRTASPSRPTAGWRSSPTPTARTCWRSTPRRASRRRSCDRCPDTCRRASSGRAARSTFRSATARTSRRSRSARAPPESPSRLTVRRSRRSPPIRCRRRCASGSSSFTRPTATSAGHP